MNYSAVKKNHQTKYISENLLPAYLMLPYKYRADWNHLPNSGETHYNLLIPRSEDTVATILFTMSSMSAETEKRTEGYSFDETPHNSVITDDLYAFYDAVKVIRLFMQAKLLEENARRIVLIKSLRQNLINAGYIQEEISKIVFEDLSKEQQTLWEFIKKLEKNLKNVDVTDENDKNKNVFNLELPDKIDNEEFIRKKIANLINQKLQNRIQKIHEAGTEAVVMLQSQIHDITKLGLSALELDPDNAIDSTGKNVKTKGGYTLIEVIDALEETEKKINKQNATAEKADEIVSKISSIERQLINFEPGAITKLTDTQLGGDMGHAVWIKRYLLEKESLVETDLKSKILQYASSPSNGQNPAEVLAEMENTTLMLGRLLEIYRLRKLIARHKPDEPVRPAILENLKKMVSDKKPVMEIFHSATVIKDICNLLYVDKFNDQENLIQKIATITKTAKITEFNNVIKLFEAGIYYLEAFYHTSLVKDKTPFYRLDSKDNRLGSLITSLTSKKIPDQLAQKIYESVTEKRVRRVARADEPIIGIVRPDYFEEMMDTTAYLECIKKIDRVARILELREKRQNILPLLHQISFLQAIVEKIAPVAEYQAMEAVRKLLYTQDTDLLSEVTAEPLTEATVFDEAVGDWFLHADYIKMLLQIANTIQNLRVQLDDPGQGVVGGQAAFKEACGALKPYDFSKTGKALADILANENLTGKNLLEYLPHTILITQKTIIYKLKNIFESVRDLIVKKINEINAGRFSKLDNFFNRLNELVKGDDQKRIELMSSISNKSGLTPLTLKIIKALQLPQNQWPGLEDSTEEDKLKTLSTMSMLDTANEKFDLILGKNAAVNVFDPAVQQVASIINELESVVVTALQGVEFPDTLSVHATYEDLMKRAKELIPTDIVILAYVEDVIREFAPKERDKDKITVSINEKLERSKSSNDLKMNIVTEIRHDAAEAEVSIAMRTAFMINDMLKVRKAFIEYRLARPTADPYEEYAEKLKDETDTNDIVVSIRKIKAAADKLTGRKHEIIVEADPEKRMKNFHTNPNENLLIVGGPASLAEAQYYRLSDKFRNIDIVGPRVLFAGLTIKIDVKGGARNIPDIATCRTMKAVLEKIAADFHAHPHAQPTGKAQIEVLTTVYLHALKRFTDELTGAKLRLIKNYIYNRGEAEIMIGYIKNIWMLVDTLHMLYRINQSLPADKQADMSAFVQQLGIDDNNLKLLDDNLDKEKLIQTVIKDARLQTIMQYDTFNPAALYTSGKGKHAKAFSESCLAVKKATVTTLSRSQIRPP